MHKLPKRPSSRCTFTPPPIAARAYALACTQQSAPPAPMHTLLFSPPIHIIHTLQQPLHLQAAMTYKAVYIRLSLIRHRVTLRASARVNRSGGGL